MLSGQSYSIDLYSKTNYIMNLSMLCPLYMAEISPPELRGSLMALEQFSIVLGVVFGFWTGFLTRSSMLLLLACSFPLISQLLLPSSRFLVMAPSTRYPNHPRYHPCFRMFVPPSLSKIISFTREI